MYKNNREKVLEVIRNIFYSEYKELKEIGSLAVAEMYIINNEFVDIVNDVKHMDKIQQEQVIIMLEEYFNTLEYNEYQDQNLVNSFNYSNNNIICNINNCQKDIKKVSYFYDNINNILE